MQMSTENSKWKIDMSDEKLLLNATDAAEFIGVHRNMWADLKAAGELPPSVRLRNRDYWNRETLKEWAKKLELKGQNNEQGSHNAS